MRGKKHPPEVRAAVMAALLAGQGVTEVAASYNIDHSVVSRWRKKLGAPAVQKMIAQKLNVAPKTDQDEFSELLTTFLKETLITLTTQIKFFRTGWLKDQSASEVATLFGVTADKAFRLFEAAQAAHESIEQAAEEELERLCAGDGPGVSRGETSESVN